MKASERIKTAVRNEAVLKYCKGKTVLDIGCVNHDIEKEGLDGWLHSDIRAVAAKVVGVDFLEKECGLLREKGYDVKCADITRPVEFGEKFDVVAACNVIEHLGNVEGFFCNVKLAMKPGGLALISTDNPFYCDQYYCSVLKNGPVVNPEHTCWFDPQTLQQIAARYGFEEIDFYWCRDSWFLPQVISHGGNTPLDILSGRYRFLSEPGYMERIISPLLVFAGKRLSPGKYEKLLYIYKDELPRYLYLKLKGSFFSAAWGIARIFLKGSIYNRYSNFLMVLRSADL